MHLVLCINKNVFQVAGLVNDAIEQGAEVVCGGGLTHEMGENFFAPTLLSGCTLDMRISHEEIFGPVVAVMKFKEADDALTLSNRFVVRFQCPLAGAFAAFHTR